MKGTATINLLLSLALLTSCDDTETGQISRGSNQIGPATTQAVNARAVSVPAVRRIDQSSPESLVNQNQASNTFNENGAE